MRDIWARLRERLGRNSQQRPQHAHNAPPLRAELFGADQMEQHGAALAGSHELSTVRSPDQLLGRLRENETVLLDTCRLLTGEVKADRRIAPAGEWLLDNFYLIEEQIRTARRHLPRGYSRELLQLANGPSAGRPRVYDIALEAISHGDGRVDPESLSRFVAAYQKTNPLTLGELWAIPIMLRLALIENLRRVAALVTKSTRERSQADAWADLMMEAATRDPKNLILVVADMARSDPPIKSAFVAELARRLQGQSAALALPLTWIEQRLSESGFTIQQRVQSEARKQASGQVSISNSIGTLRFLGATDWREFVETMSGVEQTLREDPNGVYARMDFATRDSYRHAVEKKARQSGLSEIEVARKAIQLALEGAASAKARGASDEDAEAGRVSHVGYYLIGRGLPTLERAILARLSVDEVMKRACRRFPLLPYLGSITLLTLLFTKGLLDVARDAGLHGWTLVPMALVCALCVSSLAIALVNWGAMLSAAPRRLPRLDFSAGIPAEFRTLVVVPAMLISVRNIADLAEALEVRFLANRDTHLQFALLTDYTDADAESLPEDESLLLEAARRIEELNRRFGNSQVDFFFLFHRPRRWNPRDGRWMGYERKRGKLADLNALLCDEGCGGERGSAADNHSLIVGRTEVLSGVRYVITLDSDTQLPRDSARQFAGTMAHPLNRPHFDAALRRVTSGYGILQPRVAASLPGARQSLYSRILGSEPGIDPYTLAVSDVYQDLFAEGSFIGKGIYDVDAFERALRGRLPENRILSHDLLEGCYARAGLLSDVQLYEEHPSDYNADVAPPASLDTRRLADCVLAAASTARGRRGFIPGFKDQSAIGAVPVEDS